MVTHINGDDLGSTRVSVHDNICSGKWNKWYPYNTGFYKAPLHGCCESQALTMWNLHPARIHISWEPPLSLLLAFSFLFFCFSYDSQAPGYVCEKCTWLNLHITRSGHQLLPLVSSALKHRCRQDYESDMLTYWYIYSALQKYHDPRCPTEYQILIRFPLPTS